jgi:hypothetical protein
MTHRLSRRDQLVLRTLLPSGADPRLPLGIDDVAFPSFYEEFQRTAPALPRRAFRLALLAATWIAPLLVGRAPPLGRLGIDERERALEAMASARFAILRQLFTLLKMIVALSYGADARVRSAVGYGRPADGR